ncbi:Hsp33 family molecular chaperone HslO [Sulfobacillus harzensis]|uniref:Hsp33 family molecular chaperone HslO n=1 Tax=Sulfobacillus harzensis TaxID=2729629 RepID=UPI003084070B
MISTDYRIRATAADGLLRAAAISLTATARTAQEIHQAWPVAAAAMGRLMTTAGHAGRRLERPVRSVDGRRAGRGTIRPGGGRGAG